MTRAIVFPAPVRAVLDRLGRLIGAVKFLEAPSTREAVERAAVDRFAEVAGPAIGRAFGTARETEERLHDRARAITGRPAVARAVPSPMLQRGRKPDRR